MKKGKSIVSSQVSSKGQTTIPLPVRTALGLRAHDRLVYEIQEGQAIIRPAKGTVFEHRDTVRPKRRPEDLARVRRAVKKKVAERATKR